MSGITRRNFIGATSAAAGLTFGGILSPEARGDIPKMRLGIIGTGARGLQHLREGLWGSKDFEIVAVADVYRPHQKGGVLNAWLANAGLVVPHGRRPTEEQMEVLNKVLKPTAYYDYQEMLIKENLAAVVIATPPHTHATIIKDCLAARMHVFCEAPMTTGIVDARNVVVDSQRSCLVVQIGHQRRYHPNYNLVLKQSREDGVLGRITQAQLERHLNSPGHRNGYAELNDLEKKFIPTTVERHLNWRLYVDPDGGPCSYELAPSIDVANWFAGAPPLRVFASGGTSYWLDERTTPDNFNAIFTYESAKENGTFQPVDVRDERQNWHRLNKSYRWQCAFSFSLTNALRGTREFFYGDQAACSLLHKGNCALTPEVWSTPYRNLSRDEKIKVIVKIFGLDANDSEMINHYLSMGSTKIPLPDELANYTRDGVPVHAIGSEESSEVHQFRAFAEHIRNGGTPRANVMVGLAAVIAGESARRSYETGLPVDIDPALMEFDFETPSISMYDENAAPIPGTTELM